MGTHDNDSDTSVSDICRLYIVDTIDTGLYLYELMKSLCDLSNYRQ